MSCDEWHSLANIPTQFLGKAMLFFMVTEPEPFKSWQWAMIFSAEIAKRSR